MADSTLAGLTAATPGTAGLLYAVQGGADRKLSMTAAGASMLEAANAAAQRTLLGLSALATVTPGTDVATALALAAIGSGGGFLRGTTPTVTGLLTITQGTANAGVLVSTGFSLTGADATSMVSLTGTLNTSGDPSVFLLSLTNTASGSATRAINFKVGGTAKLNVGMDGKLRIGDEIWVTASGDAETGNIQCKIDGSFRGNSSMAVSWTSGATTQLTADLLLQRDDSGILAQRNGANTQALRVYNTYTNSSNYERLALQGGSGYLEVACETAGTGADDLDLKLTPAGAGRIQIGTAAAADAQASGTHTIGVKDSSGTSYKLLAVAG